VKVRLDVHKQRQKIYNARHSMACMPVPGIKTLWSSGLLARHSTAWHACPSPELKHFGLQIYSQGTACMPVTGIKTLWSSGLLARHSMACMPVLGIKTLWSSDLLARHSMACMPVPGIKTLWSSGLLKVNRSRDYWPICDGVTAKKQFRQTHRPTDPRVTSSKTVPARWQ